MKTIRIEGGFNLNKPKELLKKLLEAADEMENADADSGPHMAEAFRVLGPAFCTMLENELDKGDDANAEMQAYSIATTIGYFMSMLAISATDPDMRHKAVRDIKGWFAKSLDHLDQQVRERPEGLRRVSDDSRVVQSRDDEIPEQSIFSRANKNFGGFRH